MALPMPMSCRRPRQSEARQIKSGWRQADSFLPLLPPPQPRCTSFISCSLYYSNGDAGSITRGTGHSGPRSPTEHFAWHQDRSLEVHPHVHGPQVFIFATGCTSRPGIVYPTLILSNENHRRSIFCPAHHTCTSWGDDSSLFPQCRTPREIERPSRSSNLLDASQACGRPSVRCLSPSKGAGLDPSFRLPGRIGDRTELPLFSTPLPKYRRQCPDCPPGVH